MSRTSRRFMSPDAFIVVRGERLYLTPSYIRKVLES